ncbi:hypothetical protein CF83_gp65 [Enterococcus phage IME_EF3]|uniref:Uncharacterized protein n=1 Tax=Enterococcus phage IME_EF3 TaxID=1416012 RepID=V5US46_9CAUD|nr:hypothetical protein CF83_gp65 [Enterococcus phage IME_EF3]AHB79752.1 hypothetical protein [Enterococcus phage IME_EF3]
MTLKIKCSYVADGEPFTLGRTYTIYCESASTDLYYIKDDLGFNLPYRHVEDMPVIDGLLRNLNDFWHSHFTACNPPEPKREPEKDIKKEVHNLLDKATELIYNNQEELDISFDDFITLIRIKEDLKC